MEDLKRFCGSCNDYFYLDHFYQFFSKERNKIRFQCRKGRKKKEPNFLEKMGFKRKEGTKSCFNVPLVDGRVFCKYCNDAFDESHFNIIKYKNRKNKDKEVVQYTCKKHDIRFREDNPQKSYESLYKNDLQLYKKDVNLQREYGITLGDYNNKFMEQQGCCAICNKHQSEFKKPLFVDHDHDTGKVRGLLCNKCNWAIGLLDDSIKRLESAINYLEKYNSKK